MSCEQCAYKGTNCDCDACRNGACNISAAAMLAADNTAWPTDAEHPPGGALTPTSQQGRAEVTSNCMFGPPNETLCQRRVRQVSQAGSVYRIEGAFGAGLIGLSPYNAVGDVATSIVNVPTEDLTACIELCELSIRVQRFGAFIIGTAAAGVAVGLANLRSAWWATENNVAAEYSTAGLRKFGRRLLSTDGRCNCDCIKAWSPFDIETQLEFTYPTGVPNIGDVVTLEFQVERKYYASTACVMPERCGQPVWAGPVQP